MVSRANLHTMYLCTDAMMHRLYAHGNLRYFSREIYATLTVTMHNEVCIATAYNHSLNLR